jgi:hypothetical protein
MKIGVSTQALVMEARQYKLYCVALGVNPEIEKLPLTVHVNSPDIPSRHRSHETKSSIQSNAGAITGVGESPS